MYLYIGYNKIVNLEDIVGIFDIQTLREAEGNFLPFSSVNDADIKSVVIYRDGGFEFSKIRVSSLFKRYRKEFGK
ncbi:MAG: hypothetical protein D6734_04515 [Candidatus Schekmanbacteria bacterium]|nr:MAG: hypothetical protein D6734_04515 [Candidatus Schekmanbacteria bacterium]